MPTLETLSIDLPAEMVATVRQAVQAGDYASQNDAVQDAIRHWAHERNAPAVSSISQLSAIWQEAIESDKEYLDFDEVFDKLQAKYDALAESERS
jgi:antitoxin ParD1/3/4